MTERSSTNLGLYTASISHLVCRDADAWHTKGRHWVDPIEEQFQLLCLVERRGEDHLCKCKPTVFFVTNAGTTFIQEVHDVLRFSQGFGALSYVM